MPTVPSGRSSLTTSDIGPGLSRAGMARSIETAWSPPQQATQAHGWELLDLVGCNDAAFAHQEGVCHQLERTPVDLGLARLTQRGEALVETRILARETFIETHDLAVDRQTRAAAREFQTAREWW